MPDDFARVKKWIFMTDFYTKVINIKSQGNPSKVNRANTWGRQKDRQKMSGSEEGIIRSSRQCKCECKLKKRK
jgi:hypothetical protein